MPKKNIQILIPFALIVLLAVVGCSSDSGTNSDDNNNNDDPVSFSQDVNPIIQNRCALPACHAANPPESGFSTASYQTITGNADHGPLVVPGDANSSNLYLKTTANPPFDQRMPRGMQPLSTTQMNTIRDWINEGALDN